MKISPRALLVFGVVAAALGCADLKGILSLQRGLAREFQTSAVGVNLHNSAYLTVTFSNAPIAEQPEHEQAMFARRVAEYVRDHYAHYERLQSIQVGFASVEGVGITFTRTRVPYRFTPSELGPPRPAKAASAPKAAIQP